jgi:hypothetical protein
MSALIIELAVLGVIVAGFVALLLKLLWPKRQESADAGDPWAQHNESAMPSLENAPEAGDTAVDAAVAAQDLGLQ